MASTLQRGMFIVAYLSVRQSVDPSEINMVEKFVEVNVVVSGSMTYNVMVPILVNTKAIAVGTDIVVRVPIAKRAATTAPSAEPVATVPKAKSHTAGKGKGKAKGRPGAKG